MYIEEMRYPLSGEERKRSAALNQEEIQEAVTDEQRDAFLWRIYDSPISKFSAAFQQFLPEATTPENPPLKTAIEGLLAAKKGKAIGVEFGGLGSELFRGFTPGFFALTRGMTLVDGRSKWRKNEDAIRHHDVIEGDMQAASTQSELHRQLGNNLIDFGISHMVGGFDCLNQDPYHLGGLLATAFEMLAEGGVFHMQYRNHLRPFVSSWKDYVVDQSHESVSLKVSEGGRFDALQLLKGEGAPQSLPLLPAIQTFNICKTLRAGNNGTIQV